MGQAEVQMGQFGTQISRLGAQLSQPRSRAQRKPTQSSKGSTWDPRGQLWDPGQNQDSERERERWLASTALWVLTNIANVEFAAAAQTSLVFSCFKLNHCDSLANKNSSSKKVVADLGGTGVLKPWMN